MIAAWEGTVRYWRSSDGGADCLCCDGAHVFAYSLEADPDAPDDHRVRRATDGEPAEDLDWKDLVYREYRQLPEGSRVRIAVEHLESPAPVERRP